ncbi:interleukin-12 subunit beta [Eucyclogobius newberryi]|uniref:interleukin-12 subunit beta n=1 Tax=Eucyclogobius newberryi TaxID=166745 RepID=UPI003B5AF607
MDRLVSLALFVMLCFFSTSFSANTERLMDNVVVLRVRHIDGSKVPVSISCGETSDDQLVTWRKNGVPQPELQGNHIQVMVQEWDGGNYTCHHGPGGPQLNHTLLMVQLEPDNRTVILEHRGPEKDFIHCSTPNYRGSFHCSWSRTKHRLDAAVLLVKGHRNQQTVSCKVDPSGSGMLCEDNNCPYKEEQHRISLTLYMGSASRLEAYTKTFYLRDIVAPGRLPNLELTENVFSWDYPETWEKPCSYFSLLFQVKAVRNGEACNSQLQLLENTTSQTEYRVDIRAKRYVFCVRARDKHTGGPWSHWSHYR